MTRARLPGDRQHHPQRPNYDPDVIEAVLAHQDRNAIRRTYNRATYWEQQVTLMQEWGDLLDALKAGR